RAVWGVADISTSRREAAWGRRQGPRALWFLDPVWEPRFGKLCFPSGGDRRGVFAVRRNGVSRKCVPKQSLGTRRDQGFPRWSVGPALVPRWRVGLVSTPPHRLFPSLASPRRRHPPPRRPLQVHVAVAAPARREIVPLEPLDRPRDLLLLLLAQF